MVYPGLLMVVGLASIFVLLNFVVPRFASVFEQSRMVMPLPTKIMLEASKFVQAYGLLIIGSVAVAAIAFYGYIRTEGGRLWWDTIAAEDAGVGRRAAQGGDGPVRAGHGDAGVEQRAAGAIDRDRRGDFE